MSKKYFMFAVLFSLCCPAYATEFPFSTTDFTTRLNSIRSELSYPAVAPVQDNESATRRDFSYQLSPSTVGIAEELKATSKLGVVTVGTEYNGSLTDKMDSMIHLMQVIRTVDQKVTPERGTKLIKDILTGVERDGAYRLKLRGATASCVKIPQFICVFRPDSDKR